MSKLAFLGLGAMGTRMVEHLIAAGHHVTVWNRTRTAAEPFADRGAAIADTPADAAKEAEIVISMVRDDDASRTVWMDDKTGALTTIQSNAIAVECSTLSLEHIAALDAAVQNAGASFVAAPLAGTLPQAEAGQLIFFAAGPEASAKELEPVLLAMGSAVHQCGVNSRNATLLKLIVNSMLGVQIAALAELLATGEKYGLSQGDAMKVLDEIPVISPPAKRAGAAMAAGKFAPQFPIELVAKDFGYVTAMAQAIQAQAPVCKTAEEVFRSANDKGFGNDNINGVVKLYL